MRKNFFLSITMVFLMTLNCLAQNNRYHFNPDNNRLYDPSLRQSIQQMLHRQEEDLRRREQQYQYDQPSQNNYYNYPNNNSSNYNYQPAKTKSANIIKTWLKHDVESNGIKGLEIHTELEIYQLKNMRCAIGAYFYNSNYEIMQSVQQNYSTQSGQVAVSSYFVPNYEGTHFDDLMLFIPYSALNLKLGKHTYYVQVVVFDDDIKQLINSSFINFEGTGGSQNERIQINKQNCFDMLPKLFQQYRIEKWMADSLKQQAKINTIERSRLLNESNELNKQAELTKKDFFKALSMSEDIDNDLIKQGGDKIFNAYISLGQNYYYKACIINIENYYMTDDRNNFEIGTESRSLLLKSLEYYEKANSIEENQYGNILHIRQLLKLDEYNPTFNISSSDVVKMYPNFKSEVDYYIIVKRVIISNNQTIVELSAKNRQQDGDYFLWITINKNTYLNVNGQKYYLTKAEGIGIKPDKTYYYDQDQKKEFALYFPAIPKSTEKMDLIEPEESNWKFYDIELK